MSRSMPPIDVRKSLYDTDGYRHTLVQATPVQILTLLEGFYWLWDRMSGLCLVEGMTGMRLSNTRPPRDDVRARRQPVAETRAFLMAQEAVQSAAASAARAITLQAMFGDAPDGGEADAAAPAQAIAPPSAPESVPHCSVLPDAGPVPMPAPVTTSAPVTTTASAWAASTAQPAAASPLGFDATRPERPGALGALVVLGLVGLALLVPGIGPAPGAPRH